MASICLADIPCRKKHPIQTPEIHTNISKPAASAPPATTADVAVAIRATVVTALKTKRDDSDPENPLVG